VRGNISAVSEVDQRGLNNCYYVETWKDLQNLSRKRSDKDHGCTNSTPVSDVDDYVA
jgi:hypothetical protein